MARRRTRPTYIIPAMAVEAAKDDRGAAMAIFLLENTGSIFGKWEGYLSAETQRLLFGQYIGRGSIRVDGKTEEVMMWVSVAFGTDSDLRFRAHWRELLHEQPPVLRNDRFDARV